MAGYDISVSPDGFDEFKKFLDGSVKSLEEFNREYDKFTDKQRAFDREIQRRNPGANSLTLGGRPIGLVPDVAAQDRANLDAYLRRLEQDNPSPSLITPKEEEIIRRTTPNNGPKSKVYTIAGGANQDYAVAQRQYERAEEIGDEDLLDDATANLIRKKRALDRQNKLLQELPTHRDPLLDAFLTSRIGPGGRLLPLINRLKSLGMSSSEELETALGLSPESATGAAAIFSRALPALGPLAAGVGFVGAGIGLSESAQARNLVYNQYRYLGGASPVEAAKLQALGIDPSSVIGFGNALHNGSYGANYFRGQGINDFGDYTIDKAKNYQQAIDRLRDISDPNERLRVARGVGLEDKLWMADLDQQQYNDLKNSIAPLTPEQIEADRNYRYIKELRKNQASNFFTRAGIGFEGTLADAMGARGAGHALGSILQLAGAGLFLAAPATGGASLLPGLGLALIGGIVDEDVSYNERKKAKKNLIPAKPRKQPQYSEGDYYRSSLDENGMVVGGGARARSSQLPPGIIANALMDKWDSEAMKLGAFSL